MAKIHVPCSTVKKLLESGQFKGEFDKESMILKGVQNLHKQNLQYKCVDNEPVFLRHPYYKIKKIIKA